MRDYVITTDSTADLSLDYIKENNVHYLGLNFTVDEKVYSFEDNYDIKLFYDKMREGMKATTMQANMLETKEFFESFAKKGLNVLHIAFSSALSGSCATEQMMANEVMEEYPDIKIIIVDSLAASGGQGLVVSKAVEKKVEGFTLEENIEFLNTLIPRVVHYFTVEDMVYLYRGGRVSKGKAMLANAINIKPILNCNIEGKLVPVEKARGRKKSLKMISDMIAKNMGDNFREENPYITVYHADSIEDARLLGEEIKSTYGIDDIRYELIGPTIGAHCGPGSVGIFYIGNER